MMVMEYLKLFILSFIVVAISLLAMGINLLLSRKSTFKAGSCGNLSNNGGDSSGCSCGAERCCTEK